MEDANLYTSNYLFATNHDYFKPKHFKNLFVYGKGNQNHRWTARFDPSHMHKLDVLAKILQHRYSNKLTRSRVLTLIFNKVFDDLNITGDDD